MRTTFQTHAKALVRDIFANAGSATLLASIIFQARPVMPSAEVEVRVVV